MKMEKTARLFVLALLPLFSAALAAEVKVVVHPSVLEEVNLNVISNVFLGKVNKLPSGHKTVPVDLEEGESTRDEFYLKATRKDPAQLKAYWSRLIFTGKGQPPKAVFDDREVLDLVRANPNIIGYVNGATDTEGVRVILTLN